MLINHTIKGHTSCQSQKCDFFQKNKLKTSLIQCDSQSRLKHELLFYDRTLTDYCSTWPCSYYKG
ncbi:hypothetical protein BC943DRAFT_321561 [Umbelopsis sp. AD052]|nr:hypothetical protein BC943DRAFT_321561 [Umbelopsis sp. AD052]